ncbi:MAG TPA: hypothetical protein VKS24_12705 [Bradyrhizobium sp.]|nr:hypothetical protein [Bradyrhizobium sp.]
MVGFPLLLIPLAVYNIIVFLMPGFSLSEPVVKLTLMSGAEWPLTLSDMLLALGIILLLFEVIKGARPGGKYLTDHLLSLIIFGAAAAEFLLWPRFASSTYFLLVLLTLADFLSGITLRARRGAQMAAATPRAAPQAASIATEVKPEPAANPVPAAPAPAAQTVPEPVEHPEVVAESPSPEVLSPGLQPGNGVPRPPDTPPR